MEEEKSILDMLGVFGEKSKDADELVAHTLQSIANMERGNYEDILYNVKTRGGEDRYIHKSLDGLPQDTRREGQYNNLRMAIQQNPSFSDTLSYEEGRKRLEPSKGIMKQLLEALGY